MQSTDYERNFMVIIPVARKVSFQSFLFKATTFTLELFNVMIKPRDIWTIFQNPCLKRGMLVQNAIKDHVKAVGECINVVPVYCPSVRLHKA